MHISQSQLEKLFIGLTILLFSVYSPTVPLVSAATLININTASAAELDTLQGIGPTKAAAIVSYRGAHGPFKSISDIQEVSGIGPATFANIQASITVGEAPEPVSAPKPSPAPVRSNQVQPAPTKPVAPVSAPVTSTQETAPQHDQVIAPTALVEPAAVGAAVTEAAPLEVPAKSRGLFSLWTLGLIATILLAGTAFVFL